MSPAVHEFQGLAVLEAVQLGCIPVLPNRLVYPQIFGLGYVYLSAPKDLELESAAAVDLIQKLALKLPQGRPVMACVEQLKWPYMRPKYEQLINSLKPHRPS